ncbi:hypothetical protein SEPCBS57363_006098 [Sporothrix epigloea]|uniref:N-acetyltransferase domain-containing protein n=1 Tax=Sporothrix epigloea TaxID=1892477 RepID=A0ABP0E169_9PEZI
MADHIFPTAPSVWLANCVLRPYRASDLEPLCAAAKDPAIARYMRDAFPSPYDRESGLGWLRICHVKGLPPAAEEEEIKPTPPASLGPSPDIKFAICLLDGTFVGGAGLRAMGADGTDRYSREIGYWIGKHFWGRGLATEVAAGLGRWALSSAGRQLTSDGQLLQRIEAGVYADNLASVKVLERAGYVREGVRRQAVVKNGAMHDVVIYGLIASDVENSDDI